MLQNNTGSEHKLILARFDPSLPLLLSRVVGLIKARFSDFVRTLTGRRTSLRKKQVV